MELNSILDWAILFSVIQLNVWQILHIRKSVTTWQKFKDLGKAGEVQTTINVSLYNRIVELEKRCPPTRTDA